jgi:hypothetical protein
MDNEYLLHDKDHNVVICIPCGSAMMSTGVSKHYKERHTKDIPFETRKKLISYVESVKDTLSTQKEIVYRGENLKPVKGLTLISTGCECMQCGMLYGTVGSMMKHCEREHKWTKSKGPFWEPREVSYQFQFLLTEASILF